MRERHKNDVAFRLRRLISLYINHCLKKSGNKKDNSISKYLPYTIEQLIIHLESLFAAPENLTSDGKVWMTWKNQGSYKVNEWRDDDISTWRWNIDHIIPQSDTPYTSMSEDNFKKSTSLSNLRPYSAKQNNIDGSQRLRHKKIEELVDVGAEKQKSLILENIRD